jgi:hypothetical protein
METNKMVFVIVLLNFVKSYIYVDGCMSYFNEVLTSYKNKEILMSHMLENQKDELQLKC